MTDLTCWATLLSFVALVALYLVQWRHYERRLRERR